MKISTTTMYILVNDRPERRLAIVSEHYALILKAILKTNNGKQRPYCAIELVTKDHLKQQGFVKLSDQEIHGFLGLIEVDSLIFAALITGKAKVAAPIPGETANKIYSVDFFCLNDDTWDHLEIDSSGYPVSPENGEHTNNNGSNVTGGFPNNSSSDPSLSTSLPKHPCFEIRKLLSNGSFYYSSDFDLTSTLQHRGYGAHSLSADVYEDEYMWNSFMMQEIISYRDRLDQKAKQVLDDEGFLTTVIRGFAETFITYVRNTKIALTIICKQSWKRAGTRFNARGVDDDSNVANFVETELIMYSTNYCFAFTQIRGSIPAFWEQDTSLINPKVTLTRSIDATQPIFDKHFKKSIDKYGPVHVVNLLATKSSEIELSNRYKDHITRSKELELNHDVFYTWFDFHKETAQEGFAGVQKLIPKVLDAILTCGYFAYDVKQGKIISEQHGIFRTNCLDCLDRTNLGQQTISLTAFKIFLQDFNFITKHTFIDDDDFVTKHNTLWADHGDQISQIYTGTNALKSSFSRKGKMSFAGALSDATKSVSRMYINNFMDKGKQQNIDTLLGRLPHQEAVQLYDPINEYITSKLDGLASQFTSLSNINIFTGTYNVGGTNREVDLSKWLFPIGDKFRPDVVILGLQEVIELTAGSLLSADYSKSSFWENMVSRSLNQFDEKYLLLRVEQMSSLLILFFVKADKANNVKQVEGATKKTGFGGMAGNKGAVAIRFKYQDTSFCFVNMHLSAGVTNVDDRRADYESISRGITFSRSNVIDNHDSIFWLGDSNFRLNLNNEEVRRELVNKNPNYINNLLRFDQLTDAMKRGLIFRGFQEAEIKFRPTYKFDTGSDRYDTSEKARTPSWTDRIVYKGDNINTLAYSDAPLYISDHKPVFGAFRARVKNINEVEKLRLTEELLNEYRALHPEEVSSLDEQLVNIGINDNIKVGTTVANDTPQPTSLLDIDPLSNNVVQSNTDDLSSSSIISTSNTSSFVSLNNSLLQPNKSANERESTPLTTTVPTMSTNVLIPRNKPLLRPPPPSIHTNIVSNLQNSNNTTTSSPNISVSSSVITPILDTSIKENQTPQVVKNNKDASFNKSNENTNGDNNKMMSPPPPGFSGTLLTPKNVNSNSNVNVNKHIVNESPISSSTPIVENSNSSADSNKIDTDINSNVVSDTNNDRPQPPGMTLDSWQPLTPK